jgi:enoyl-CoA hydratase/carnithine racemase
MSAEKQVIEKATSRLEKDGPVATITFSRPERRNALDTEFFKDLYSSLADCDRDDSIRVVVLAADGPVFCAGQNLKFTHAATPAEYAEYSEINGYTQEFLTRMGKPVIAKVQGPAAGGGCYIMVACDIIVCAEEAWVAMREIFAGVHSGGTHLLSIGLQRAREINLTGRRIYAQEAYEMGMINRVVKQEDLDAAVQEYVDQLIALPPLGLRATKMAMRVAMEGAGHSARVLGGAAAGWFLPLTEDNKEAKRSFVEKRPPVFQGR